MGVTYYCPSCWSEIGTALVCPMSDADVRSLADESYQQKLIRALRHPEPTVPIRRATILGELGSRAAVEPLIKVALSSPDLYIKEAAVAALGRIGDPRVVLCLYQLRRDGALRVKEAARRALQLLEDTKNAARPCPALAKRLLAARSGTLNLFVNREVEMRRLQSAILSGQSLMICGPSGIGKTALVLKVLADLPNALAVRCLCLSGVKDLQDLLRQLVRQLYELKDPRLRRELHAAGVSATTFDTSLRAQSSSHLRGALYRSVEGSDYRIFLDHLPPSTLGVAKVIKELFWMRDTPVYLMPYGMTQEAFGRVSRFFYWGDRDRLVLGPLPKAAAEELLESCIGHFDLSGLDLSDFREEVVRLTGQVPRAIVTMCELAADPRYHFGRQIKTKLLHIDYLMRGHDFTSAGPEVSR